jgi:hypothetical protein
MSSDSRCKEAHAKIMAGTCPWCRRWILDGEPDPNCRILSFSRSKASTALLSYADLRRLIHQKLTDKLDLSRVSEAGRATLGSELRRIIEYLCDMEAPQLTQPDRYRLVDDILHDMFPEAPQDTD